MALLVSQTYAGVFLNAADLFPLGKRWPAVIHNVHREEIGQEKRQLLVLDLVSPKGAPWKKRAPMNKTNSTQLAAAFGDDASLWPGRAVALWAENVMYQGKLVPGIRAMPSAGNGAATPPAATAAPPPPPAAAPPPTATSDDVPGANRTAGDLDDDIPF